MVVRGHVRNGVVIPEEGAVLPEGAEVRVEVISQLAAKKEEEAKPCRGGWWKGQVVIAEDFDELPDDLAEAFGTCN